MNRALFTALTLSTCLLCGCAKDKDGTSGNKGEPKPDKPTATITGVRWDERRDDNTGTLYVQTTDGSENLVEVGAIDSWFSQDRLSLYYTYRHEKSGFEREGMGVKRFSVSTDKSDLVFDYDLIVLFVREVTTKKGRIALVVDMIDGGRGAPEVAVADPDRGRVYFAEKAHTLGVENGVLEIGYLTDKQIDSSEVLNWPKSDRTEKLDLDELLGREASRETPNPLPID